MKDIYEKQWVMEGWTPANTDSYSIPLLPLPEPRRLIDPVSVPYH